MNLSDLMSGIQQQRALDAAKVNWSVSQWLGWLNEPVLATRKRVLSSHELLAWSGADNRFLRINEAAATPAHPAFSIANVAKILIMRESTSLDLNLSDRQQLLGALAATGVLEQSDADSLYAMASAVVPRYETLGLGESHEGDIAEVLRRLNNAQ